MVYIYHYFGSVSVENIVNWHSYYMTTYHATRKARKSTPVTDGIEPPWAHMGAELPAWCCMSKNALLPFLIRHYFGLVNIPSSWQLEEAGPTPRKAPDCRTHSSSVSSSDRPCNWPQFSNSKPGDQQHLLFPYVQGYRGIGISGSFVWLTWRH